MERLLAIALVYSLGHAGIATWQGGGERRTLAFVFHACLALSAIGWAFVALNGWYQLTAPGWWPILMAVGAVPSFVLMLAAFLVNLKLRLGAWPWLVALVLCGAAFGAMLAAARFMRWKWW